MSIIDFEAGLGSAGDYLVQVKVIDILGNDTTRTLKVEIK